MTTTMTMKAWRQAEAERLGLTESAIATRIYRGQYPNLKTIHINRRVVFVKQSLAPSEVVTWRLRQAP